jgi:hypothetical protein
MPVKILKNGARVIDNPTSDEIELFWHEFSPVGISARQMKSLSQPGGQSVRTEEQAADQAPQEPEDQ